MIRKDDKRNNKNSRNKRNDGINKVEVVFILDRSGSMGGLEADTIGGFNSMLAKQKSEEGEVIWSTVLFNHISEVVHDRLPIEKISKLDEDTYYVGGSTALLDAVGGAIHHIGNVHKYAREEDRPDKTLIVITTDGMENSSVIYDYREIRRMIKRQEERYGWEFIFLGANMDAVDVAGRIGIRKERAARFHNDDAGIGTNFAVLSKTVSSMRACGCVAEDALDDIRADYESRK